jgi:hypothetical protein
LEKISPSSDSRSSQRPIRFGAVLISQSGAASCRASKLWGRLMTDAPADQRRGPDWQRRISRARSAALRPRGRRIYQRHDRGRTPRFQPCLKASLLDRTGGQGCPIRVRGCLPGPVWPQGFVCPACGGGNGAARRSCVSGVRLVRKARLKLAQRSRTSHPISLPPDADRRRKAPPH